MATTHEFKLFDCLPHLFSNPTHDKCGRVYGGQMEVCTFYFGVPANEWSPTKVVQAWPRQSCKMSGAPLKLKVSRKLKNSVTSYVLAHVLVPIYEN